MQHFLMGRTHNSGPASMQQHETRNQRLSRHTSKCSYCEHLQYKTLSFQLPQASELESHVAYRPASSHRVRKCESRLYRFEENGSTALPKLPVPPVISRVLSLKTDISNYLFICEIPTKESIILRLNLKITLRMVAHRADFRSLGSDNDMSAIGALPNNIPITREHQAALNIC